MSRCADTLCALVPGAARRVAALLVMALLASSLFATSAQAKTINADTLWSGVVEVSEDTRVAAGATLTIEAGTRVVFDEALSTKTDPQFWSPQIELAIEGRLVVEGDAVKPVTFEPAQAIPRSPTLPSGKWWMCSMRCLMSCP